MHEGDQVDSRTAIMQVIARVKPESRALAKTSTGDRITTPWPEAVYGLAALGRPFPSVSGLVVADLRRSELHRWPHLEPSDIFAHLYRISTG